MRLFGLGWRRACSAKSSVSTRPLPVRTPSLTSSRRRSSRMGRATSRWARIGQGIRVPEYRLVEPALIGARSRPVLHEVVFIAAAHQGEQRTRGKPARPGEADLEVDQTGLASLVHEDVFALVQVDVNDLSLMHCVE